MKKNIPKLFRLTFLTWLLLFFSVLLVNAFVDSTHSKTSRFFLNSKVTPTATIAIANTELCLGEQTNITFEGANGTPNYIFTYTINDGAEQTITTENNQVSVSEDTSISSSGTYVYKLIKVEDSTGVVEDLDQEITITVTDPPTVDFTFTNDNACSGETIQFTSNATGNGTLSYSWNFGDGTTSTSENPTKVYNIVGNGSQVFSVSLIVSDANGCFTTIIKDIQVHKIPDIDFFSGSGGFINCSDGGSGLFNLELFNNSVSRSEISSYTIDWGDETAIETFSGFPTDGSGLMHAYPIGIFTLSITATNVNGCTNSITYNVSNGSNPGGAFETPGSTVGLCLPMDDPESFYLTILDWGTNQPNTTYSVDFGDGNIQNFTQQDLEDSSFYNESDPDASEGYRVYHSYTRGSCLEPDGEFIATLTITNDCGDTQFTVDSINVLEPSEALFDVASNIECINTSIEFENLTLIGDGINCNKKARFTWNFGDGTFINTPFGSNADNQTHTYTSPGNYTVILSVIGDCGTDTYQEDICIEPEMIASYDLNTQEGCIPLAVSAQNTIDESELCSTPTYNWTVSYTDANCGSAENWGFTNGTDASSENPQFLFNNPGEYTLTQSIITNCGTFSTEKVINVKKPPTAAINPITNFCQPGTLTPIAIIENCTDNEDGVTYNWTFLGGTPATSTIQNPENISYDTAGTFEVTLTVTNECGVSTTATQQFEVLEKPIITNSPTTQEICSNQSTTQIPLTASNTNSNFIWTATTVPNNPNITGFISNGTSQVIPSQAIINNGTTPGSVVFTVTPVLNGCLGDPVEVLTVIVNPTPIITTQPVGSEICLDGTANTLEVLTQNGVGTPTYQWYASTTNTYDLTNPIVGATNSTFDPPTNTVGEIFYFVVVSFEGGCDPIQSSIALVNTVPEPTATAVNPEQTICVDGQAETFTIDLVGGLGNPTYQWFSNTTNTNTGGTAIAGATNNTYDTGVLSTIGVFYYYIEVTLDGIGCDLATSEVFTVHVVQDPVIDTQAIASQEICQNTTLEALEVTASGDANTGDFSYQWFSNTTNSNTGGTAITGANANVYNPDNTTVGSFFYYVVVNQTASGCQVTSAVATIIVNEGPSITTQPVGSEICLDGTANTLEVLTQNGVGTPTYQWYASTTNTYDLTNPIVGATNNTFDPPTNTVGEIFYFVVVSFEGGCDPIQSSIALVNTVPEPTATAVNPEQTICVDGQAETFTIDLVGGLGNPTYQWFSNTTNTNTGGTAIAGATNNTYDTGVLSTIGVFYYYIEVTLDGIGCDLATSEVFTVHVVQDPVIDTQAIASQEICQNTTLEALEVTASGDANTGDFSYQWFLNTTNSNTGGTAITGANANVYNPDNTTVGSFFYYVVVNQTASGCQVTSAVATIIVNEGPSITTQPVGSEICLDGTANTLEVLTQNGVGTPTYQWYASTTNAYDLTNPIVGATNNTFDPPTNTVGEIFYFVVVSFEGGCDPIQSSIALVNTVPEPTATAVNPEQTICVDGQAETFTIDLVGGLGNPTYQWFSNTTNTNTGGTAIAGATNNTYDTGVLSTIGVFYYYIEVTLDGIGCDLATSEVFTVHVVQDPVIDTQAIASQEICQNTTLEALEVTASGDANTGDFSYQWFLNTTNSNTGGTAITGANANVYNPDNTTVGSFFYYVVVNQTASGCQVTSAVATIIVNEGPSITTQPVGSEICLDGTANTLEVLTQNGVGTPTYQWYASTTNAYDLTNPIVGATNSTFDPPTNTVGEIFYFVVVSFEGGCDPIQSSIALVNTVPEPTATAVNPEQTICVDGQAETFTIDLVGGLGNPTYQWFSNTTNTNTGGTAIAGATNNTYDTGVLSTIGVFYYYIEVTLDGIGCDLATSEVFTVHVVQDPVIDTQAIASQEICQNTTLEALEVTASGDANTGDFSYQWFLNTTNSNTGGTAITGANANVYNPDNTTVGSFFYYVVVNQTASGCQVTSAVATIIVNEGPSITTQPVGSEICLDGTANTLEVLTQNGVGTPTYQWYASTTNAYDLTNPIVGATNSTFDPPTNTVGEIFYFVVVSFEGGCDPIQSSIALVNTVPEPTATAVNPEQTICVDGQAETFTIDLVGGLGNPTYQWFSNTTNTNTGGTAIAGATNNTYDTGVLSTIGVFYYYIEVTLDGIGCDLATSEVFTVHVVQDPVIDTQAIASQEICQNTTLEALEVTASGDANTGDFSYQWFLNTTNSNTGGTAITGANANVYNPDNTTVGSFFYYVVVNQTASGCQVTSAVATIIVNEGPSITTQPVGSEICLDGTANTLEVLTQNGVGTPTYQWYASTTNAYDLTNPIVGATNNTFDPPTNTVGEIFYFVVVSFEGGCDPIQSSIALVNTVPEPTATAVNPEQTICVDGQAETFTIDLVGGLGNPTYQWFSNTTNTNTGGTAIAGATNNTYDTGVLSTIGVFYYYIEVTLDGIGCDLATSEVFTVHVVQDPVIDTQAIASQEICQNTTLEALEVTASGDANTGDFSYQWFLNTTNSNTGGTAITGANANVYNPDNTTVGSFFYYVVVNQTASGCQVTSAVATIIVNEGPSITTQPVGSEICLDGTANTLEVLTQNGVGTPTYQWYASTTNAYDLTNPIVGATNNTFDPPTNTVGEIFYFVVVSFEGGCDPIQSSIALVNTVPEPTATAVNPEQTICVDGQAETFTIDLVGGLGNPTYQWFSNTTNTNTGGTAIAGATNNTYDTGVLSTIGVFYYYIEVTLDGIGCDLATSEVFTVHVVQDPVIDTQAIASQEICQNTTLEALEVTASGDANTGDFSYQWFLNTTNSNTGGTAITGANANVYNPDNTTVGSFFYYVVVNQTASGCQVTSAVATIIVNEGPSITTQPVGSEICLDGTANTLEVLTQNGVGTPTYQWYASTTNAYDLTSPIVGATNSTFDPPTNTVGEIFYFVVVSFEGGCDPIQSSIALVNTVPEPTATAVNPEQTICVDGQAETFTIDLVGGLGNPTYQWFSNTTNTNTGGTAIAGATNNTYDTGVLSTIGVFYYYIEVTLDGIGCDLATSEVFTVHVVQDPVIDTQAIASQEICQNTTLEALEVTASGDANTGDFSYQWFSNTTNSNTGGTAITGANANVYNPDNTTVGSFFYYVVVNQTASGCQVTSAVATIIVNEGPSITTQPVGSEICLDGTANTLEVLTQNGVGTPTYQWYASTTNAYDLTNPIVGATNSTFDPPTNTVGEIFYFVVVSFEGGCDPIQSSIVLVKVNQIPVIDFAEITIYSEETFVFDPNLVTGNIVPTGTTYTWTTPTSSSPGAILGSSAELSPQTNISQTLENTDIFPVIETYTITPATPSCIGNSFRLEVTVNPKIISNVLVTSNTCFESNDGMITTNITGGVPFTSGTPYLISWTGPNSFTSTASSISNLIAGLYTLRIEDSNGVSITEQYTVTQPDLLTITTDLEKNISCFDGNDGAIEVSISGGTLSYTFNWTTTDGSGIVQGNEDQSGLTAGTYNLELTDANQCVTTQTFMLTEPQAIAINTVLKEDILCFGDATGAIEIAVTGGTPIEVSTGVFDYRYSWTGPNGFTSNNQNISNLVAGTYTIEITDELNCTERAEIILTEPTAIDINYTKTDATCYGATDGSIDVTVTGGRPPYQISWSNLGNGFSQSNLSAGNYTVTIIDENQCEANVTITIEQPIFFIAPIVSPISCNNANDASIDLNLTGGIAPITVSWSDDPSAGVQRNNLGPGTYVVTIIDSDIQQCPIEETFIITNPPAIAVTSIVTDATDCNIENSGSILLDISGGTPPYDFIWNTGQTTKDLNNIPAGDYTVEIRDENDCIEIRQFGIFRQDPINIAFTETLLSDCIANSNTVENTPIVTGGFLPYTYSWSAGITSGVNNETMTTDQSGAYTLTVTDGQGCIETATIQVDVAPTGTPDFSYSSIALTQYGLISIDDPIQFTNLTTGSYSSFSWDFGDGSPVVNTLNPVHTYDEVGSFRVTLTVVYESGCVLKIGRTLNITLGYSLVLPNAFTPNDDGINDFMRPIHRGFTEIEMSIYDTWGALIYYEKGISLKGWDGLISGSSAENGNYILDVKGLTFYDRVIKERSSITLLK